MKSNNNLKWIIILLLIFFSLKSLSELVFVKGAGEDPVNPGMIKLSTQIFPLVSGNYYTFGKLLLEKYTESKNRNILDESRRMFKRSLFLNNLNFASHFLLGRSYLADDSADPADFEKGLRLIKNASTIRRTNLGVNVNTIKIYLSLWPFISKKDRQTAISLMNISMLKIKRDEFEKVMETWGFYSKDSTFLLAVLNRTGKHYPLVLKELIKHELDLKFRHKLMAQTEYFNFKRLESKKSRYSNDIEKNINLYRGLGNRIKGYYNYSPGGKFRETALIKLKRELLLKAIRRLISDLNSENVSRVISVSDLYFQSFRLLRDVEVLDEILTQKNFFNSNDMKVFYLKQLINIKTGQFSKMINETEGFRQSVTFVKEGQEKDLAKLLTLLADGYTNSRLLTKAMDILKEIEKITPGLLSTYWRLMKIESIIGEDDVFSNGKDEKFAQIRNSSNILISGQNIKVTVWPYEIDKLIMNLDEPYSEKFREFHLLQVFMNGRIFHETYIEELKFPIEITLPKEFKKVKFEVEINLVK